MEEKDIYDVRKLLCRITYSLIFASLLYHFYSYQWIYFVGHQPYYYFGEDLTYWLFFMSGFPQLIISAKWLALTLDLSSVALCLLIIIRPKFVWAARLFFVLYFVNFLLINALAGHHAHFLVGILLICIPFLTTKNISFYFLWKGLRYLTLFIYSCAFLWKLLRGTWILKGQGLAILQSNVASYLYFNPDTHLAHFYYYFLSHPGLFTILYALGLLLEAIFVIGFFTEKYDYFLFAAAILFHTLTFIFVDVFFAELLILNLTFIKFKNFSERSISASVICKNNNAER